MGEGLERTYQSNDTLGVVRDFAPVVGLAGDDLYQEHTKTVDICLLCQLAKGEVLRSHVSPEIEKIILF